MDTSYEALESAVRIAIRYNRTEIVSKMESFLSLLDWVSPWAGDSDLVELAIEAIVQLQGLDAFDKLVKELYWIHRKWDCGSCVDDRIVNGIISMGKEVIPKLQNYLYKEWGGLNEGTIAVLEGLGEDPGDYYSVSNMGDDYDLCSEVILLKSKRNTSKAIEEIMRYGCRDPFHGNNVAMKKWVDNLSIPISPDELLRCIKHSDTEISAGACYLAQYYVSPKIRNAVIEIVNSNKIHAELILYAIKHKIDIPVWRILRWIAKKFTLYGFDLTDNSEKYEPTDEAIHEIVQMVIENPSMIQRIRNGLKSKIWQRRAASILLLWKVAEQSEGPDVITAAGLSNFLDGFFYATKRDSKASPNRRHLPSSSFEQMIVETALHLIPGNTSATLTQDELLKAITTSVNPEALLEYVNACPYYIGILSESKKSYEKLKCQIDRYHEGRGLAKYANILYSVAPNEKKEDVVSLVVNSFRKYPMYWTLSKICQVMRHVCFRRELVLKLKLKKEQVVYKDNIVEFISFIREVVSVPDFYDNQWLMNRIDGFIEQFPSKIKLIRERYTLDSIERQIRACDYLKDHLQAGKVIAKQLEEITKNTSHRPERLITTQNEPTISKRLLEISLSLRDNSERIKTYEIENLVRTKDNTTVNLLNMVFIKYLKNSHIDLSILNAISFIPKFQRKYELIEIIVERIEDIIAMFTDEDNFWRVVETISKFRILTEHPSILKALFEKIILSENPLDVIGTIDHRFHFSGHSREIFKKIVFENVVVDATDWIIHKSFECSLKHASRDKRVIDNVESLILKPIKHTNPIKQLVSFPHLYQSRKVRDAILSKRDEYISKLQSSKTKNEEIEIMLSIEPFFIDDQLLDSLLQFLKMKVDEEMDPLEFSQLMRIIKEHMPSSYIVQLPTSTREYLEIKNEEYY